MIAPHPHSSLPSQILPIDEKPLIADSITITGIFASVSTSKKTGHQTLMILSGGKPSKVRNLYSDPAVSQLVSGSMITVVASDIEWLMSDFNGITYGSRSFDVTQIPSLPAPSINIKPIAPPVNNTAPTPDKKAS